MATEVLKIQSEARDLVARSRLGDQNATSMLIMIRNSAAAGSKRAIYTLKYLKEYIKRHPMVTKCRIGFGCSPMTQRVINTIHSQISGDPDSHADVMMVGIPRINSAALAAVPLANNGNLLGENNPRIKSIHQRLDKSQLNAFEFGRINCFRNTASIHGDMEPGEQEALHLGKSVGIAQRIQAVRDFDDVPVSALSSQAGWELGE